MKRSRAEIDAGGRRLAAAIKAKRESLGLSQPEAAAHFGVKLATLQAIEQRLGREFREETLTPFDQMIDGEQTAYELFCPPPEPMATKAEVDELREEVHRQGDRLDLLVRLVAERIPVSTGAELTEILEVVQRMINERNRLMHGVWQ